MWVKTSDPDPDARRTPPPARTYQNRQRQGKMKGRVLGRNGIDDRPIGHERRLLNMSQRGAPIWDARPPNCARMDGVVRDPYSHGAGTATFTVTVDHGTKTDEAVGATLGVAAYGFQSKGPVQNSRSSKLLEADCGAAVPCRANAKNHCATTTS